MIDYTEWDGFGIRFSTDFTSSIDFFGRVCFFFFDRMMRVLSNDKNNNENENDKNRKRDENDSESG